MNRLDRARLTLAGLIAPAGFGDRASWEGWFTVDKYEAADVARWGRKAKPYESITAHNLLVTSGADAYHQRIRGTSVTAFDATNARLGVGDSTTAPAIGQTNLQASTNVFRKIVDAAPGVTGNTISFVATFTTAEANFAWNEAGIFNAASSGVMLNRVQQAFGTKTSSLQWVLTGTIALS